MKLVFLLALSSYLISHWVLEIYFLNLSQLHSLFSLLKFQYPDLSHQHFLSLLLHWLNWSPSLHRDPSPYQIYFLALPTCIYNSSWILSLPNLKSFSFAFRVNSNHIFAPACLCYFIFNCCQSSGLCTSYCLSLEHYFFLIATPSFIPFTC